MANTKNTETTKSKKIAEDKPIKSTGAEAKTVKTVETNKGSNDGMKDILSMMEAMRAEITALKNDRIKLEEEKNQAIEDKNKAIEEKVVQPSTDEILADKIKVYHLVEMLGGTCTYISLSGTKRELRRAGELMTLDINDFEELAGKYYNFFKSGILAISSDNVKYAELYNLPIYDQNIKKVFSSSKLNEVLSYTKDQLQEFYESMSESMKEHFLTFWLGKVYEKAPGYYDEEKMRWLNSISGTSAFSAILLEIGNKQSRGNSQSINADNM